MEKAVLKDGIIIELARSQKVDFKEGDWLVVRLLNGKELVLEKPKTDYWEENFEWGKEFAKKQKIKPEDVLKAISGLRSGK